MHYPLERDPVHIVQSSVRSATGIWSPDRPSRTKSLYRMNSSAVRARDAWVEYQRANIKVSFYTDTKKTMIEMNLFHSDYLLHARVRDVTGRFGKEECSGPPPHAAMLRWCARAILLESPNLTFVKGSLLCCCRVNTDRSISIVAWQCIISYISAVVQKQYSIIQRNMVRKRIESIIMKLLVCT